jgi:hypothetical protein
MRFVRVLLLLAFSVSTQAEESNPKPPQKSAADEVQVYTKQSSEAVDNLNKATEVLANPAKALLPDHEENKAAPADLANNNSLGLTDKRPLPRDPTQMSGNFRQALKNMPASNSNGINPNAVNNPAAHNIPTLELAAKIMGKHKSVMLKVNNKRIIQIVEGEQFSLVENNQLITIRVEKITKNQIRLLVSPPNEHLILQ